MALTLFVDHQFTSPFGMSAYVSLLEKGIPFVTERLDLGAQQHQQATYRKQSLTARVPTLIRKLPQIENNMKIEASISLRRRDEEVKVHGEPDCCNLG